MCVCVLNDKKVIEYENESKDKKEWRLHSTSNGHLFITHSLFIFVFIKFKMH